MLCLWLDNIGRAARYAQREERPRERNEKKVATVSFFSVVVVDPDPFLVCGSGSRTIKQDKNKQRKLVSCLSYRLL